MTLAGLGLYGLMSYTVNQRIPEMGIRMAMGATPGRVMALVVRQGMGLALGGMAAGTVAALVGARLVASMLVGIGAADPVSFALATMFLAGVALLATWLPAFRMTRNDPMASLRR